MLDQRKLLTGNDNLIDSLVSFENTIKQMDVEQAITVKFSNKGKILSLIYKGMVFQGQVSRPLIHQLGGRAWRNAPDFKIVNKLWAVKFKENPNALEQELAEVFNQFDLSIRYTINTKGENKIYGIVTPTFIDVNQQQFRNQFMQQMEDITGLKPESEGIEKGDFGEVVENFKFDSDGFQTRFKYGLVYARNNGYEAYKVNWGREIIICTNGLKRWEGSHFAWKHTREIDLSQFIQRTIADGVGNQKFLEERIEIGRASALADNTIEHLSTRLSLAKASKERFIQRLAVESKAVGFNEWALSQSLTWLGTHEKGIQLRGRKQLTGLGTDILENSLSAVLEEESKIYYDGSYGLILPKGFKQNYAVGQ